MTDAVLQARLVRAELLEVLDLGAGVKLCAHPISGGRVYATEEIVELIDSFRAPQVLGEWVAEQVVRHGSPHGQRALTCALGLLAEGILFDTARGDERRYWAAVCAAKIARPASTLDRPFRRARDFEVSVPRALDEYDASRQRVSMLFFGACSAQLLIDFVREGARYAQVDVDARATAFHDVALAAAIKPDVIVVGQFSEKMGILEFPALRGSPLPNDTYIAAVRRFLLDLREQSAAPVFLLNLATPSCSPLGMADRGAHVNRVRMLNIELAALATGMADVHIVDVDQALGLAGRRGLVDDAVGSFGHLGSLPWLVHQYAHPAPGLESYSEGLAAIPETLARAEFETERIIAREIVSMVLALRGVGRRKCVVVDLDNTLWPGVLADNGEPFPGGPAFDVYPYGRYLGLHTALKALQARGLLLACVSRNDEDVVRRLWQYNGVPHQLFLSPDDFVTMRINWGDKAENVASIAQELNLGLDAFAFIDDNPVERSRIETLLPAVMVLGGEPYSTRWRLLTDPAFQVLSLTDEAARRTEMTRGQLQRDRAMLSAGDRERFVESLELECAIDRVRSPERLARIQELITRTHQFNTTGRIWGADALAALIAGDGEIYTLSARDRFVDYGLVGVCIVQAGTIEILVVSCRVLGLGLEHAFLGGILDSMRARAASIEARLLATDRNLPARGIYAAHGFEPAGGDSWQLDLERYEPMPQHHVRLTARM